MIGCLRTRFCKQPIIAIYFESENEIKFYNLEAWIILQVETEKEAKKLKTMVSKVSTVAIGPQILHTELLTIASSISQVYTSINTDLMHHIYRKYAPDCLGTSISQQAHVLTQRRNKVNKT